MSEDKNAGIKNYENMVNFFIASCISVDVNITNKDREENIKALQDFIDEDHSRSLFASTFKPTKHQIKIAKQGIEMLKKEMEENSNA